MHSAELLWSEEVFTLAGILARYPLPQLVKYHNGDVLMREPDAIARISICDESLNVCREGFMNGELSYGVDVNKMTEYKGIDSDTDTNQKSELSINRHNREFDEIEADKYVNWPNESHDSSQQDNFRSLNAIDFITLDQANVLESDLIAPGARVLSDSDAATGSDVASIQRSNISDHLLDSITADPSSTTTLCGDVAASISTSNEGNTNDSLTGKFAVDTENITNVSTDITEDSDSDVTESNLVLSPGESDGVSREDYDGILPGAFTSADNDGVNTFTDDYDSTCPMNCDDLTAMFDDVVSTNADDESVTTESDLTKCIGVVQTVSSFEHTSSDSESVSTEGDITNLPDNAKSELGVISSNNKSVARNTTHDSTNSGVAGGGDGNTHLKISTCQPGVLLLCQKVRGRRAVARLMKETNDGLSYTEDMDTPLLIIPHNYPGWFYERNDLIAPFHRPQPMLSLNKIVAFMPYRFLTLTKLRCYKRREQTTSFPALYEKGEICPGEIIAVDSVHEDLVKYVSKKFVVKEKMKRLLRCCLSDGEIFLLPVEQCGEFYIVQTGRKTVRYGHGLYNSLYSMKDLLKNPASHTGLVQLVNGDLPPHIHIDSMRDVVMKLVGIMDVDTVVVCELGKDCRLMEVPLDCEKVFSRAVNLREQRNNAEIRDAFTMAMHSCESYIKGIKVKSRYSFAQPR